MSHLFLHNRGIHIYQEDKVLFKTSSIPFSVNHPPQSSDHKDYNLPEDQTLPLDLYLMTCQHTPSS